MAVSSVIDTKAGFLKTINSSPHINKVWIFSIVALSLLMTTVDATIVATALHTLQHELHTTINWAGWTLTAYSFGFVLMLPVSGKISEIYGHRRVFLGSVATFTTASLLCGLSNNIFMLIGLRVIQAIGGAGITPSATGIIVNHFGRSRDRAVSLFGSVFPIGAMIGPIFGGLFVTYWTWRGIFFVNLPIGLAVLALSLRFIPHDHSLKSTVSPHKDIVGVVLLGIGIFSAMFAASYLGDTSGKILISAFVVLLIISAASLAGFFNHIRRDPEPLIKPKLIHGKGFGSVNLINVIYGGATQGILGLVPLYAVNRYAISALNSGLLLVAEGIAAIILSVVVTMLLRKTGYRTPLYIGCIIMVFGTVMLALKPFDGLSPYAWLTISTFFIGAGAGTINPPCRNAGLQLAPEHSSTIAALRSMSLQLGGIITVAIATAILASSSNAGMSQAFIYVSIAVVFVISLPLISRIPEHRGSW